MPRRRATARWAWEVTRRAQILVSAVRAALLGLYDVKMRLQIRYARSLSAENPGGLQQEWFIHAIPWGLCFTSWAAVQQPLRKNLSAA